jgi:hypothetical protein
MTDDILPSRKLQFWISSIEENNFDSFSNLNDFLAENVCELDEGLCSDSMDYLSKVYENNIKYFTSVNYNNNRIQNPFSLTERNLGVLRQIMKTSLISIQTASLYKNFKSFPDYILGVSYHEYSALSRRVIHHLKFFTNIYLCETGFYYYAATRTKYRNELNEASHFRIQPSTMKPNIKIICKEIKTTLRLENFKCEAQQVSNFIFRVHKM